MTKKYLFHCFLLFFVATSYLHAQLRASKVGSNELLQKIEKLKECRSVLYIAAHPDDENTELLTYFSKAKQYRTAYLSLTRGDGGKNLIGPEQGIELGLLRTEELLAARSFDGAEQFFTRAYDFGYSKTATQTFTQWDRQSILSDVVWIIRTFRPDIIITRFPSDERAGHGQHWASAILANEAFVAAADSTQFSYQLKLGVSTWQAQRILWNTYKFGSINTIDSTQFHFKDGGYNPLLGVDYGEIASQSRSQHKSQGFGTAKRRGPIEYFFKNTGGQPPVESLMDGVQGAWNTWKGGDKVLALIHDIATRFDVRHPSESIEPLLSLYTMVNKLEGNDFQKKIKLAEIESIILNCTGIYTEAYTDRPFATKGDSLFIHCLFNKQLPSHLALQSIDVVSENHTVHIPQFLKLPTGLDFNIAIDLPVDESISQPYWLEYGLDHNLYQVPRQQDRGRAQNKPAYMVRFNWIINGQLLSSEQPVVYKTIDAVKGEYNEAFKIYPPVFIRPALPINLSNKTHRTNWDVLITTNTTEKQVSLTLPNHVKTNIVLGSKAEPNKKMSFTTMSNNSKETINSSYVDSFFVFNQLGVYPQTITYSHIQPVTYFKNSVQRNIPLHFDLGIQKIGYIVGAADNVPPILADAGYRVSYINPTTFNFDSLSMFQAIVIGQRALNVYPILADKKTQLLQFVAKGGNVVMQYYTTNSRLANSNNPLSPYPLPIVYNRITNPDAPVQFLLPNHPTLNYPNKITAADFQGWIQERSTYEALPSADTVHWQTPIAFTDYEEPPTKGSVVVGAYGKGYFIYTALSFFRQLPEGVPGAFKLFANLVSMKSSYPVAP